MTAVLNALRIWMFDRGFSARSINRVSRIYSHMMDRKEMRDHADQA